MDLCKLDDYLKHVVGVGRRPVDDSFFNETYKACNVFHKTGITVEDDEDLCHQVMKEFPCNFLDCDEVFHNLADYEIHYNGSHRYSCEECRITRPNSRLLEIHIQETHDKFFEISSQKRPMFSIEGSAIDNPFVVSGSINVSLSNATRNLPAQKNVAVIAPQSTNSQRISIMALRN
ncbi:zinc finger protein 511 isoform X2 [Venturia canescens]|uniref:zinc finger protein 511 isoform X2 n=1 Tax=Venturia canescens TaxID=32260 RepID=UPI001C9CAAE7|nr:zinc finger protein 511 isoform X2 [Venturia canescens]